MLQCLPVPSSLGQFAPAFQVSGMGSSSVLRQTASGLPILTHGDPFSHLSPAMCGRWQTLVLCTPKGQQFSFTQHSYEENILGPYARTTGFDGDPLLGVKRLQKRPGAFVC